MVKGFVKSVELDGCPLKGIVEVELVKVLRDANDDKKLVGSVIDCNGNSYSVPYDNIYKTSDCKEGKVCSTYVQFNKCLWLEGDINGYYIIDGVAIQDTLKMVEYNVRNPKESLIHLVNTNKTIQARNITASYDSEEELKACESIMVHMMDGTTQMVGGTQKKYKLTDEQKMLIKKLESVLDECADAKINIFFDHDEYKLCAVSDPDNELEVDDLYGKNEENFIQWKICQDIRSSIQYTNCDWNWVIKKK